jgi:hypothetical protein
MHLDGKWLPETTDKQKREFYSTGATLKSPEPKWPPIVDFPTDFSDCNNGRFWDWNKIHFLYSKTNPAITKDQVKHHFKVLGITLKNPVFTEAPELETYPTDFRKAVNGNRWDYDKIVELYGIPRAQALAHFKTLNLTLKNPVLGRRVLRLDGCEVAEHVGGSLTFPLPSEPLPVPEKRVAPNWIARALLKHYSESEVQQAMLYCLGIAVDL